MYVRTFTWSIIAEYFSKQIYGIQKPNHWSACIMYVIL